MRQVQTQAACNVDRVYTQQPSIGMRFDFERRVSRVELSTLGDLMMPGLKTMVILA